MVCCCLAPAYQHEFNGGVESVGREGTNSFSPSRRCRVWTAIFVALVACREGLQKLQLQWVGSLTIGPWLGGFTQLSSMKLVARQQLTMETWLRDLPSLRYLHLSSAAAAAHIASLPTALTRLELDDCRLESLPACLPTLHHLENLELQQINLGDAHFGVLTALTRLTSLSISYCGRQTVPREISVLTRLKCLILGDPLSPDEDFSLLASLS